MVSNHLKENAMKKFAVVLMIVAFGLVSTAMGAEDQGDNKVPVQKVEASRASKPQEEPKTEPASPKKSKVYKQAKLVRTHVVSVKTAEGKPAAVKVYEVCNRKDGGFNWKNPGRNPMLPKGARTRDSLMNEDIRKRVFVKIHIMNEVNKKRGLGLPSDVLARWFTALADPWKMETFIIRDGMKFDFGTAGDYYLGRDVLDWNSNFSVMYDEEVQFAGQAVDSVLYKDSWIETRDGVECECQADLPYAFSCGNIDGNVRCKPKVAEHVESGLKPGIPDVGTNIVLMEPTVEGVAINGGPLPAFDVRPEGYEYGVEVWIHESSEIEADGRGGYKMGKFFMGQAAATIVGEVVKKFGDDEDDPYVRLTAHLGGFNAGTPSTATEESSGAGTGTIEHVSVDGVFETGSYKVTAEVDVYATQNSNAAALSIAPTISAQPEEGNGVVGAVTLVKGNTELKSTEGQPWPIGEIDSVDSDVTVATIGYRFGKNARYTPFTLDSGPYFDVRARYTKQEYESNLFRSEFKGWGLQGTFLTPLKLWTNPNDGVSKQKGLFLYGILCLDNLDYDGYSRSGRGWDHVDQGKGLHNVNVGVNLRWIFGQGNPFARE
ncbi:MAG: hypothetical protein V1895_02465 [Parcubacteria group bacterium]